MATRRKRMTVSEAMRIDNISALYPQVTIDGQEMYDVSRLKDTIGALRDAMRKRVKNLERLGIDYTDVNMALNKLKSGQSSIPSTSGYGRYVTGKQAMELVAKYDQAKYWMSLSTSTVTGVKDTIVHRMQIFKSAQTLPGLEGKHGFLTSPEEALSRYKRGTITYDQYVDYNKYRESLINEYVSTPPAKKLQMWDAIHKYYDKTNPKDPQTGKRKDSYDAEEFYRIMEAAHNVVVMRGQAGTPAEIEAAFQRQQAARAGLMNIGGQSTDSGTGTGLPGSIGGHRLPEGI